MFRGLCLSASLALCAVSAFAARYPSFGTLKTTTSSEGVMNVVINNTYSTINLFDFHIQSDLANLIETLQANDTDVRVVVFSSGNPEFFFAHFDLNFFLPGYESPLPLFDPGLPKMGFPIALLWNITQLPQATIALIEGRARGIGNEFLMSCDMRFATTSPSVLLSQLETSLGANPGAGGAMYLSQLMGRGRAFEYVLASKDIDAVTAERYGWINRAFATSSELKDYVQKLAARIALFPPGAIVGVKQGINAVSRPPMDVIITDAQDVINALVATPASQQLLKKCVAVTNNQSVGELELNYGRDLESLFK
ncbi:ClpP/crotonase-like domain-containing protein [Mycena leptocephala]|nr:ClpP/crotonase-like domain-containing protein [Mycena leptocephala]